MKILLRKGIVVAALGAFFLFNPQAHAQSGLLREVYNNVTGGLNGLRNNPNFPGNPALTEIISEFEAPGNFASNYGQRVRGYLEAPQTGEYIFWISSDDQSELYLSTDDEAVNLRKIAEVLGNTPPRVWNQESGQQSVGINLQQGQRYYIEAIMVEGGGDDHLAVRWQLPDGTIEEPIPGSRTVAELTPPQISRQPQNVTVNENQNATFTVQYANRAPVAIQWFRNGIAIPGATNTALTLRGVTIQDSGSRFTVSATNLFATVPVTSAAAILNVRADESAPTIVGAHSSGENDLVTVTFSEPLDPGSATNISNFELIGGAQVLAATLDQKGTTVILRTSPLTFGQTYTLFVNNLRDRANRPNVMDPDSNVDLTFSYTALAPELVYGRTERPGPSTRRTGLAITEIMYHPPQRTDGRNVEFIEIYNSQEFIESIGGYRISGAIEYTFPNGTFIPARGYLVLAASPVDMQVLYAVSRVAGPFTNSLPDSGTLRLENDQGAVLLEVSYDSKGPWPVAPDGAGHSLVLARPSYGEADPRAWAASQVIQGSPGRAETAVNDPLSGLVINEFLSNTDLPQLDYLELYNYSSRELDLSGIYLSDDAGTNKFQIPNGTRLAPLGFLRFDETQLGFALSSAGERIILRNRELTRVIDAVRFGPQATGMAVGRFPDGHPLFRQLSSPTPGAANARPRLPEIVINEIMYHPVSGNEEEEYLELYNRSPQAINLRGWRLTDGVDFTIPGDLVVPSGGFLTLAKNIGLLRSYHPDLTPANSIGNFNGNLSNAGERIVLERPEFVLETQNGRTVTNVLFVLVDEVTYQTAGRWPHWADGGGSSLELIDPNADNDEASNWADSDETRKSEWVTIQRRGLLSWGATNNFTATDPSRALHVIMMDEGEALLDNVQVFRADQQNLVLNPGFESNLRDWLAGGTHENSTVEAGIGNGSRSALHIRASARGDTASNRLRARLSSGLTNGEIVTIQADARWLRGSPEILLRLHGNYLELAGTMPLPKNLGSPGKVNGKRVSNPGPSIQMVQHTPVLPAANQGVRVIAEIDDPNRVAVVNLNYRVDSNNNTNYVSLPMDYHGAGHYSAQVPGQNAGASVAFYIEALDSSGIVSRFPADAPVREGIIFFGEAVRSGNFGTYRLWLSQTNINRWRLRERSSNHPLDATFVYNGERVIYNMSTLYSGSPFHWFGYNGPLANGANYVMVMPDDDLFLGQTDFVLNLPSNIASDDTGVREQIAFWMADQVNQPFAHRRFANLYINGVDRNFNSIFEDAQQPNRDFINQWFPNDPDGELYKIEDWFEYNDQVTARYNEDAEAKAYYTRNVTNNQPELKQELYRWWFRKRAVRDSAHDYSKLFELIEALNTSNTAEFTARTEALIDVDEWMGAIALRHAIGDWDAFGYSRGKNMYAYKPQNGKWQLLHWDIAFAFGLGDGPNADLFAVTYFDGAQDIVNKRLMETPVFRRAYLRTFYEIANGPMVASRVNSVIDSKFGGLAANGVPVSPPETVKRWIAQRREYILGQLASFSSGFSITSNNGANTVTTNRNTFILTGTAPVQVQTIKVNGEEYPIEWTSVNAWRTRVALRPQQNLLRVDGYDRNGQLIPGASASVTVTLTTVPEALAGRVIINEILASPLDPQTEFVELHNTSRLSSFELADYRLNGLGFTFPAGSVIPPGGFLVVARDAVGFGARFGFARPIAGVFSGAVDDQGETISLVSPASEGTNEVVISSVRVDDATPWPPLVNGASWQLIDPTQDISRVGNWAAIAGSATPGATNSVRGTLTPFPLVWVNEIQPNNLNGPTDSAGDRDPWVEILNSGTASVSLNGLFLTDDYNSPAKWAFPANATLAAGQRAVVWLDGEPGESTATEWHTAFRWSGSSTSIALAGTQRGAPAVFDYLSFEQVPAGQSFGAFPEGQASRRNTFAKATPGAANELSAPPVRVFINEWMASNQTSVQDPDDSDFDDWFELYNAGTTPANLAGYSLTDNLSNPGKFVIPAGVTISPGGYLLIWADEENSTNGQLHVNFRLSANGESLGLFAPDGSVVDSVEFGEQEDDVSEGRSPDGGSQIVALANATPGQSNGGIDPGTLRFTAVAISQGNFVLTFSSEAGARYRVEYKNKLNETAWSSLPELTAVGTVTSVQDPLVTQARFYRVVKLP